MAEVMTNVVAYTTEPESIEAQSTCEAAEYWDAEKWAGTLMQQGIVQQSQSKLNARLKEFLQEAKPSERRAVEECRTRVMKIMQDTTTAHDKRYPKNKPGSAKALADTVKDGFRAASETAYEYAQILDVMVGQAPEYVALAYGAVKILLVAQVNYEEMKQNVEGYMDKIKVKFQMIDHLTAYLPTERLVNTIAQMYDFFNRFLAKALKFYTRSRIRLAFNSLVKPWKQLEPLVTSIEQCYLEVKDIVMFHGHIVGQTNLAVSRSILAGLEHLAHLFEQPPVKFSKLHDVSEMADDCRQRVEARLAQPAKNTGEIPGGDEEHVEVPEDFDALLECVFVELQEYDENRSREQRVVEQLPEMRPYRSKQRNILKVDRVMAWIESTKSELLWIDGNNLLRRHDFNASFAVPLLILGESVCESYLILRHFCGECHSDARTGYRTLIQSLLRQIFKQRPKIWKSKATLLTRRLVSDIYQLWSLFVDCLRDVKAECIFIVIDSIDFLGTKKSEGGRANDGEFVLKQLNDLANDSTILIKILLTAALAQETQAFAAGRSALIAYQSASQLGPRRALSLDIMQNDFALVPSKLVEIQEKRCKIIKFAELPMLYPANSTIYTYEEGLLRAYVVAEIAGMEPRPFGLYGQLQIRAWSIDHNGKYYTKRYHNLVVSQFPGDKETVHLQYIPAGYLPDEAIQRRNLIERGRKYWKYGGGICYMQYMSDARPIRIVIDQPSRPLEMPPSVQELEDQFQIIDCEHLKPLFAIVCPPLIAAYILRDLKWTMVKVNEIQPINFDTRIMEKLVLPEDKKHMLLSAMRPVNSSGQGSLGRTGYTPQDVKFVLLHGAPGLGKTASTNYVAEHLHRPLISVSAGDLGATVDVIGPNLNSFLKLSQRWNAILVLEDADVIFEKRQPGDLTRNSIVMVCLRALENYGGAFILTTTRVGVIDEALEARIQIAIEYRKLSTEGRKQILENILQEAPKGIQINIDDLRSHLPDMSSKPMNGNEIHNAFKIATQMVGRGEILQWDHIAKSFDAAENFRSYLTRTHRRDATERAMMYNLRPKDSDPEEDTK